MQQICFKNMVKNLFRCYFSYKKNINKNKNNIEIVDYLIMINKNLFHSNLLKKCQNKDKKKYFHILKKEMQDGQLHKIDRFL